MLAARGAAPNDSWIGRLVIAATASVDGLEGRTEWEERLRGDAELTHVSNRCICPEDVLQETTKTAFRSNLYDRARHHLPHRNLLDSCLMEDWLSPKPTSMSQ